MKLFGVILLAGYFLAREREPFCHGKEALEKILAEWAVYLACAGISVLTGLILLWVTGDFQPAVILLVATLPAILFRGSPVCMIAGAATAFCVLKFPQLNQIAAALFCSEVAVHVLAFFYQGARERMTRLNVFPIEQKNSKRLLALFALAVLWALIYEKMVQVF